MSRVNEVRVGDKVRSYVFIGNTDCYYEGVVESINGERATFTARTTKQVFDGKELDVTSKAFTANLPGMDWFDDVWTDRIVYV